MDKFNQQFATQKLREETDNNWPETITSRYRDEYLFIHDKNKPGFYTIQDVETGKTVGRVGFNTPESAVKFAKDKIKPQGGRQSSGLGETSMTSAGATFTPGTGEQTAPRATKKIVKKEGANIPKDFTDAPSIPNRPSKAFVYKQLYEELSKALKEEVSVGDFNHYRSALNDAYFELTRDKDMAGRKAIADADKSLKDAEAAEKAINNSKITPGNKATYLKAIDGIKRYLSQPNQKNEGTINETIEIDDRIKVVYGSEFYGETGTVEDIKRGFVIVSLDDYDGMYSMHMSDVEKIEDEEEDDFYDEYDDEPVSDYGKYRQDHESYEKDYQEKGTSDYFQRRSLDESYSRFKNETKTRGKSDQFHQAIREVKKKVLEINKMYEYVSKLKEELSEGEDGLQYKMHTEKALHKIKEMVSELNKKIKRFK